MTEMRDDLRDLGQRLWPDDSALRPGAAERRSAGRHEAPRQLVSMALGTATVVCFAAVAGAGLWAHDRGGTGSPGAAEAPTPTQGPLANFSREGLALQFFYPASWRSFDTQQLIQSGDGRQPAGIMEPPYLAPSGVGAMMSTPIVAFSPQVLRATECTYIVCPPSLQPGGRLTSDGILVIWSGDGAPSIPGATAIAALPGGATTIAGHQAKIDTQLTPGCVDMGGDHSITAFIERDAPGNLFRMSACFRGPEAATLGAEVRAMLASVKVPPQASPPAQPSFSFADNLSQSDPASWAFDHLAATGALTCAGAVWPGAAPSNRGSGQPYAMVVVQAPGKCDPPPPGSSAFSLPSNASPSGIYLIHLDSCRDASALGVTINVDAAYRLHLVSEKAAARSPHPACP